MATRLEITSTCDGCGLVQVQMLDPAEWWDDLVIHPPSGWHYSDADEQCSTCLDKAVPPGVIPHWPIRQGSTNACVCGLLMDDPHIHHEETSDDG